MLHKARETNTATLAVPVVAQVAAMISLQYGATIAKGLFADVGPEGATLLRLVVAALILGIGFRSWRTQLSARVTPVLIGYGATLGGMSLFFYLALKTIPLGVVSALQFSGPLLVTTLSSRRRLDLAWICLAVVGLVLLAPPIPTAGRLDARGILFALGSAASWSLYILFGQNVGAQLGSQAVALGTLVAAILLLPIGIPYLHREIFSPTILFSVVIVGFLTCALPFSLEMVALTRLPARVYGTLTSMEPVIGALLGLLLLHEILSVAQWSGIAAVVIAALGAAMTLNRA